jgi:hypothetical protein
MHAPRREFMFRTRERGIPMTDDLLRRIEREMDERLEELSGAVDEHDRLAGELRALDADAEVYERAI